MPRIPPPELDGLPWILRREVRARRGLNVYRALMHTPEVAPSFLAMTDALRQRNSMPPALRELAILRVGHRYRAPYEVHHHERLARVAGLGEPAIRAAAAAPGSPGPSALEAEVLALTDELLDTHRLSDESRERARSVMSVSQLADFVLTVGHYQQVCNFLNVFGVEIEEAPAATRAGRE